MPTFISLRTARAIVRGVDQIVHVRHEVVIVAALEQEGAALQLDRSLDVAVLEIAAAAEQRHVHLLLDLVERLLKRLLLGHQRSVFGGMLHDRRP